MKKNIDTAISSIKILTEGLLNYADSFSFVLREGIEISANARKLISELSIYLIEEKEVQIWPGTELLLGKAKLLMYYLNPESAFILNNFNDNLYKWIQPELPEDLVFYKDSQPIFISITHEKDAYFALSEIDINFLKKEGLLQIT